MVAFWFVGRENLRLRAELDAERVDRESINMAVNALRKTLRKVWADRRHTQSAAAEKEVRLRRVVRRLWKDRRVMQSYASLRENTLRAAIDSAKAAWATRDRVVIGQREADARSLAMCEELHRV